jgi:pyruvate kinase
MSKPFKRTKILATIGPAVDTPEMIHSLIEAGVNGCRLNFSHGTHEERDRQIAWIREAANRCSKTVAILQDLQGPKIRIGEIRDNRMDLHIGDRLILDYAITEHDGGHTIPVQYNLAPKVKIGEPVFIYDGKIHSHVTQIISATAIEVEIKNDGFIMSKKGLNLPDTDFGGDIMTEKDLKDIEWGAIRDFDYVALSFVQSADDIDKLRHILASHGSDARIIAKIETKKAIENDEVMEAIVEASDGIMVARGDMGYEAGVEIIPIVQRKLVALCRKHSKLCIVATQMLLSMVENPGPTRAEVSDIANAVMQGADTVMLSEETASGKYPLEAVKEMKKVILYTQNHSRVHSLSSEPTGEFKNYDAISAAAARLAEKLEADLIIAQTSSGATAAAIAAQRANIPIISVTSKPRVAGQLALIYANSSFVRDYSDNYGLELARELKEKGDIQPKEGKTDLTVIIVSGAAKVVGGTDTIQIRKV